MADEELKETEALAKRIHANRFRDAWTCFWAVLHGHMVIANAKIALRDLLTVDKHSVILNNVIDLTGVDGKTVPLDSR